MKWLTNLLENLKQGEDYERVISELKQCEIGQKHLEDKVSYLQEEIEEKNKELLLVYSDLEEIEQELESNNKHSSLNSYKRWIDANIKPKTKYYDFGKGRRRVHQVFKEGIQHERKLHDFLKEMEFSHKVFTNVDDLVYSFCVQFDDKYPSRKYYKTDMELYGKKEYWASPIETISQIKKGTTGDCDDVMVLKYCLLYTMIEDRFPKELWRLRGFVVDILGYGGHAMLGWVKEGPNDWVPLETTFFEVNQRKYWAKNYKIRNQILYDIRYSFDYKNEYVKI